MAPQAKAKVHAKAKAKPQAQKRKASESGDKDEVKKEIKKEIKQEVESPRSSADSPQKKRQRLQTAPVIPGLDAVLKVLSDDRLELPPGNCRAMLLSMAPRALCTAHDDRHALQATAVGILDQALQGVGEQVRTQTTMAQERATETAEELVHCEARVAKCQEFVELQKAEVATAKSAADDVTSTLKEAEGKFEEAKNMQGQIEAARALMDKEKGTCVDLMEGSYKSLKEGKWGTDFAKQREQVDDVVNFLKSVKSVPVPSSLVFIEGPSVLRSKKDSRGSHAEQIFQDIEAIFNKHVATIEERLNAENEKAAALLPTTKGAEEAVAQALRLKEERTAALTAAEARKVELEVELRQLTATAAAQREVVAATKASTEKIMSEHTEIDQSFQNCMKAFTILRDHSPDAFATLSGTPSPGRSASPNPEVA